MWRCGCHCVVAWEGGISGVALIAAVRCVCVGKWVWVCE